MSPLPQNLELHFRREPTTEPDRPESPPPFYLDDDHDDEDAFFFSYPESHGLLDTRKTPAHKRPPPWWLRWLFSRSAKLPDTRPRKARRSALQIWTLLLWWLLQAFVVFLGLCFLYVAFTALFGSSYTKHQYPPSWTSIEESVEQGGGYNPPGYWRHLPGENGRQKVTMPGRGNPKNERIFIAANIINADLIRGEWGSRVMELMDLLGPENVFLSIFENDSGLETRKALGSLSSHITAHMPEAGQSIVSTNIPLSSIPPVEMPTGETVVKRITYLSEVRNRALLPLIGSIPSLARWNQTGLRGAYEENNSTVDWTIPAEDIGHAPKLPTSWVEKPEEVKRVLFLNDVVFDPVEVLHLIFNTNDGDYAAACGLDYINPFKYYDTFATRDPEGYSLGVPFFPYFATTPSRSALLETNPAIQVKSCWGGIVSFDASFFTTDVNPVRFRSETEPYWEGSECCLIHADIDQPEKTFMNPFVRSAYSYKTFKWLPAVKLVERTFAVPHGILVWALGMPWGAGRRLEVPGEKVNELEWNGYRWSERTRVAKKGGFCESRKLLIMTEDDTEGGESKRGWKFVKVPKPLMPVTPTS